MAEERKKAVFDGATLSPKLKSADAVGDVVSLPIGKSAGAEGDAVARRYKHAAGKSSTYTPEVVDMIYHMSREGRFGDEQVSRFVSEKLSAERSNPGPEPPVTWDQLVFLSANLTRLVIDPYRERCNAAVVIGVQRPAPVKLEWPIVFGGMDFQRLPAPFLDVVVAAARRCGAAVVTPASVGPCDCLQILELDPGDKEAGLAGVAAVQLTAPFARDLVGDAIRRRVDDLRDETAGAIPIGVVCPSVNAAAVVDDLVAADIDFCVADAQWTEDARPTPVLPEAAAAPAIGVLADVVERLRHHCREEQVQVVYRGGIRGGADAGKAMALGARAVSVGFGAVVSTGLKLGNVADEEAILSRLEAEVTTTEASIDQIYKFAKSIVVEVTMLARACGKSDVVNMEPEDMRSLTRAVSAVTGVGIAGKEYSFRVPAPGENEG